MKNLPVIILVLLIAVVLGVFFFSFKVSETEVAVLTTFGEPVEGTIEPGWHFKLPQPIQKVKTYDSRARLYETALEETTTSDLVPLTVSNYIVWRIEDPLKFLQSVGTVEDAKDKLYPALRNTRNSIIGEFEFNKFVNADPEKIKFEEIELRMEKSLAEYAAREYGIKVETVGIKQIGVSADTTKEVFERMKAERQRRIDAILAEGKAESDKIRSDAEAKQTELLAIVDAQAQIIRGAGDAEAAQYYEMLKEEPEFAIFLRDIEALREMLKENSTIVLGAKTEPVKLLDKVPDIQPNSK